MLSHLRQAFFYVLLILFLGLNTIHTFGQNSSSKDVRKHQQLFYLCKVWGFLYYYHPAFANTMILWEKTLRNSIDTILNSSHSSVQSITESLLHDVSARSAARPSQHQTRSYFSNTLNVNTLNLIPHADFHWLRDTVFAATTQQELETIRTTSLPLQSIHYLSKNDSFEPIIFSNPAIESRTISKTESLMSLFILWNAINYVYPHKAQCAKNWDSLLIENIPRFLRLTTNADYLREILTIRSQINDSHAVVSSSDMDLIVGRYNIPMKFFLCESGVVIQELSCCDDLHLQGWIVQEINDVSVDTLINSFSPLVAASNKSVRRREIARMLRHSYTPRASMIVSRGGEKKRVVVDCLQRPSHSPQQSGQTQNYYRTIEISNKDTVVCFDLSRLQPSEVKSALNILKTTGKKGVIFDLRKYPTYIVYDIMQSLANQTTFGAMARNEFQYPGYHSMLNPLVCGKNREYFGKVVILVNEYTQSRGEFTAQALRTIPGAKVVGSQTAGADGEVLNVVLPMNIKVQFTINAIFDTQGKSMQGAGILPDVEVRPTVEGISAGRDEVLEKGVEVLRELLNKEKK